MEIRKPVKESLDNIAENEDAPPEDVYSIFKDTYREYRETAGEKVSDSSIETLALRATRTQLLRRDRREYTCDLNPEKESAILSAYEIASPDYTPNQRELHEIEERLGAFNFTEDEIGWWARKWNKDHYVVNDELVCNKMCKFDETDGEIIYEEAEYQIHVEEKTANDKQGICYNCNFTLMGLACLRMQRWVREEYGSEGESC